MAVDVESLEVINPATGGTVRTFEAHGPDDVARKIAAAAAAFGEWRRRSFDDRAFLMRQAADHLRQRQAEHARLMTEEMGKPIAAAEGEVEKCAWVCDYFADHADDFLANRPAETEAAESFVRFDPLGPVLAIMPWNFPFWQVFRFAVPALMAGNVGLLKHASNVPGCATAIEEVFRQAGFPEGVFTSLLVSSDAVGGIIADPAIRAVTLTGSDRAGRAVARQAGEHLKKTVLELGGSDPFVVLADADPVAAAAAAAAARTLNSGQSCIAAKRFIVAEAVADRFTDELVRRMESLTVGNPMDRDTDVGPLARGDLRDDLHDQVRRSVEAGARLLTGGKAIDGPGFFYAPTVLGDVEPGMAAFDEETFGPVAAVVRAHDTEHAVDLANRSPYGLGASIWTARPDVGQALAEEIEAGSVFINEIVKSDPRLPFGGIKDSGYGRELSDFGIREFVNVKTVWTAS